MPNDIIRQINEICGAVNFSSHKQMREAIEQTIELSTPESKPVDAEGRPMDKYSDLLDTVKIALYYRDFGVLNEYLLSIGEKKIAALSTPPASKEDREDKK